jgi:hypothetical protein
VDLPPLHYFFPDLEQLELDVFGKVISRVGGVELFWLLRSATKHRFGTCISLIPSMSGAHTCLPSSNMILGEFGFYPCQTMRLLGLEVQYLFGPAVYTGSIYASFHK